MDHAALVFGFRKDHRDAFQHTEAFIADNETHACKAPAFEPSEEVQPAFLVLFHTFRCTEDLTKSVFVDANSDQNGYILNLVEVADGARRDLRASKRFGDIFDTAHGYAGKVHLNKGFLDRAFTAFVAFDDGRLELDLRNIFYLIEIRAISYQKRLRYHRSLFLI